MATNISCVLNCLLMFGVLVPPTVFVAYLRTTCSSTEHADAIKGDFMGILSHINACDMYTHNSGLYMLNLIYFLVVDVGFYLIYLAQGSTWLIDPYWQIIPMAVSVYHFTHPDAILVGDSSSTSSDFLSLLHGRHPRAVLVTILVNVWGVRLFYNWGRRERWQFGKHEDWRYNDMRKTHGKWWIITQFFAVSLAQHGMLVGLTLPLAPAMSANAPALNMADAAATCVCVVGMLTSMVADNQLWAYMQQGNRRAIVLDTGLWRYSRHPNHFGEQTWWVGLLIFTLACTQHELYSTDVTVFAGNIVTALWPWAFGVLFNHPLDTLVTLRLIEKRMHRPERGKERIAAFKAYQKRTSLIFPWPPLTNAAAKEKTA